MTKMLFQTTIQRNRESIYALLTNLRGYPSWLPSSSLYTATQEISDHPIQIGTTYVEKGTTSIMRGQVTVLEPDHRIVFVQTVSRPLLGLPSRLDINITYTLEPYGEISTQVTRGIVLKTHGLLAPLQPLFLGAIRKENKRILQKMKLYLEAR